MTTKRERNKRLMVLMGYTAQEIQAAEQMAARQSISIMQLMRHALNLYEARERGIVTCDFPHKDDYQSSTV